MEEEGTVRVDKKGVRVVSIVRDTIGDLEKE